MLSEKLSGEEVEKIQQEIEFYLESLFWASVNLFGLCLSKFIERDRIYLEIIV